MTDKERDGQSRSARPIIYFVLPRYNEAEGLRHTAEVLRAKVEGSLRLSRSVSEAAFCSSMTVPKMVLGISSATCMMPMGCCSAA